MVLMFRMKVLLATTATTLNFVGGGVVASGTGVTKTITIAGGGGSGVGGTWTTYDSNTGVTTTKKVKIQNDLEVTGVQQLVVLMETLMVMLILQVTLVLLEFLHLLVI